ncbi:MAG: hypothetical protein IJ068_00595 [Bacilli bacterium]|nr:hypothetical protein [Bacilli bacterium]
MALFESLKMFPKVDLHVDYFGSINKEAIYELTKVRNSKDDIDEILEFSSLTDYNNTKELVKKLLNSYENIDLATDYLLKELKEKNTLYAEIYLNLNSFLHNLDKNIIIKNILNKVKSSELNINIVLEIDSSINKEDLYDNLNILYEYYNHGINGVYFKKNKLDNIDSYKSLFDKFIKDDINYIVLLDSKITSQNKDIYYNASHIIYNLIEIPSNDFLEIIKENNIILEFPITYQSFFNLYDDLKNHIIYDLFKLNVNIAFTTIDMNVLDTDLLNEYCKIFNVFPFSLHDLVMINLNILNNININDNLKSNLISEFREKANLIL